MKCTLPQKDLLALVRVADNAVDNNPIQPILGNLRISVASGCLSVVGSDTRVEISASITGPGVPERAAASEESPTPEESPAGEEEMAEAEASPSPPPPLSPSPPGWEDGMVTVSSKKLFGILRSYPEDAEVQLSDKDGVVEIRTRHSKSTLATMVAEGYPTFPSAEDGMSFEMRAEDLIDVIRHVSFAMAVEDVRYVLNGMLLEVAPEHVRGVASDGHRMAVYTIPKEVPEAKEKMGVVIPRKSTSLIPRLFAPEGSSAPKGNLRLSIDSGGLRIESADGALSFVTKLVGGNFPRYEATLPERSSKVMTSERLPIRKTLERAKVLCGDKYNVVDLSLKNDLLTLQATNFENERLEDTIAVDYQGEDLKVRFDTNYLGEILGVVNSRISMYILGPSQVFLFEDPDDKLGSYILMPVKV